MNALQLTIPPIDIQEDSHLAQMLEQYAHVKETRPSSLYNQTQIDKDARLTAHAILSILNYN